MAIRMQWEDACAISVRKNVELSDTAATPLDAANCASMTNTGFVRGVGTHNFAAAGYGVASGVFTGAGSQRFGVALVNHPEFDPGQEMRVSNKVTGFASPVQGDGYDFTVGIQNPTTTYEFQVDYWTIVPFMWCLFHKGASETGGVATFIPPVGGSSQPEAYASLLRKMSAASTDSQIISDAIVTAASFRGSENEPLTCSCTFMGRISDVDFNAGAVTFAGASDATHDAVNVVPAEKIPLLWQNAQVFIESTTSDTPGTSTFTKIEASDFNLDISVAATAKRYNSKFPTRYSLGAYAATGSITLPWGSIAGTDGDYAGNYLKNKLIYSTSPTTVTPTRIGLAIVWKAAGTDITNIGSELTRTNIEAATCVGLNADGDFSIYLNTVPTSVVESGDDETMVTYGFTCAEAVRGGVIDDPSMQIKSYITSTYGIP